MLRPTPRFVRHTGIAAPFRQPDLESELIAPVGADLEDLHAVHLDPGNVPLEGVRLFFVEWDLTHS